MKKLFYIVIILLTVYSCSKKEEIQSPPAKLECNIHFSIDSTTMFSIRKIEADSLFLKGPVYSITNIVNGIYVPRHITIYTGDGGYLSFQFNQKTIFIDTAYQFNGVYKSNWINNTRIVVYPKGKGIRAEYWNGGQITFYDLFYDEGSKN